MTPEQMISVKIAFHSRRLLLLSGLLVIVALQGVGARETMPWSEATAKIAGLRSPAETCAEVLKKYGSPQMVAGAALTYSSGKGDVDGLIAGLIVVVNDSGTPDSLPSLQVRLQRASSNLRSLCAKARDAVTPYASTGLLSVIGEGAIEEIIKGAFRGVATVYNDWKHQKAVLAKTIQSQLEAARWRDFAALKPA